MEDDVKHLPVSDPYRVPIAFANQLVGSGYLNGVVNLTLAAAHFTPQDDGKINPDLVITARLRMDLFCAQQLHEHLGRIIEQNLKDSGEKPN